jgi:hypothetical protein
MRGIGVAPVGCVHALERDVMEYSEAMSHTPPTVSSMPVLDRP